MNLKTGNVLFHPVNTINLTNFSQCTIAVVVFNIKR